MKTLIVVFIVMGLVCLYPIVTGYLPWYHQIGAAASQCFGIAGALIYFLKTKK